MQTEVNLKSISRKKENIVKQIIKDANINDEVIKVYDTKGLQIYSDITEQIVTCS